ncbi:unnamed protein product [Aphanomyces euteiches]
MFEYEGSFDEAIKGTTSSLLHRNTTRENILDPVVKGTLTVLQSCAKTPSVCRVALTSTLAAMNFNLGTVPSTDVYTEVDWSPEDLLEKHEIWYPLGKTIAERKAHEFIQTEAPSFSLAALNQTWIFDPMLQPTLNESSQQISHNFTGDLKKIPNDFKYGVDVRDLAAAHVAAFENPDANGAMFSSVGKRRKPRFARI